MTVSRRRLFQSIALAGATSIETEAAGTAISLDALRSISTANGTNLNDERLRIVQPVLESRLPQVQALRDFPFDDAVAPTQGILDK